MTIERLYRTPEEHAKAIIGFARQALRELARHNYKEAVSDIEEVLAIAHDMFYDDEKRPA